MTFGEFIASDPEKDTFWHSVIVMPASDADALAQAILEVQRKLKEVTGAAKAQADGGENGRK
jgi:hypothetical protein